MGANSRARIAALLLGAAPAIASAQQDVPLGPFEVREEYLLVQNRLSLPARAAAVLPAGGSELRFDADWGNDFAADNTFRVDGEHATFAFTYRRGITRRLTLGARLPISWRGGGILDGVIEKFHDVTGLPDGGRPGVPRDLLDVRAIGASRPLVWEGSGGAGLGRIELDGLFAIAGEPGSRRLLSLDARVALPTASGAFSDGSFAGAVQLLGSLDLGRPVDLHAGAGVAFDDTTTEGFPYEKTRGFGFLAFEWRPFRRWAFLAQFDAATQLTEGIRDYPGAAVYLRLGARLRLGATSWIEGGFSEGLTAQRATTDFGVFLALGRSF